MKIEISGNHCVGCAKYTQYYSLRGTAFEPINRGFCGAWQRTTKPGDRCREYLETSNAGIYHKRQEKQK